ncbi:hypothetical protein [Rhizobium leguminosarum]|uniref:hypothetical protein n=1 Tax=Rhizobium leguminosarum TaxID=384 RepID=UPI001AE96F71|nr:hypothetical protein [Rhizobium leguminosarum]MBP2444547.1 hypothetical protein [Rhizobium leguminosarum]
MELLLHSRHDLSPNRMIAITGPDYSLEQVSSNSTPNSRRLGRDLRVELFF